MCDDTPIRTFCPEHGIYADVYSLKGDNMLTPRLDEIFIYGYTEEGGECDGEERVCIGISGKNYGNVNDNCISSFLSLEDAELLVFLLQQRIDAIKNKNIRL